MTERMTDSKKTSSGRFSTVFRSQAGIFLALAMIVTLIPSLSETVYADTVMGPPSSYTYVDVNAFNTAGTDYGLTTGKSLQAVYFGTNRSAVGFPAQKQKWWIAGYDESGLVLMCDPTQPLKTGQKFKYSTTSILYNSQYGTYENSPANELYPNHYGASDVRSLLNDLAANESCFTQAEQGMMKETTVYTYDASNHMTYSTTDKLYLAAGCFHGEEITVGQNRVDSSKTSNEQVDNGLKIGLKRGILIGSPFTDDRSPLFWTRSPGDYLEGYSSTTALEAIPSNPSKNIIDSEVNTGNNVVPAFALDTRNVLFASSAAAGESFAELEENRTMTFRCDGAARIRSTATFTHDSVTVDYDDTDSDVYLYVQGSDSTGDWVFSQKIERCAQFPANDIRSGANLTNCKIWLETVEDNIAYAKPASYTGTYPNPLYGIVDPPASKSYTYRGKEIRGVSSGEGYGVSGSIWGTDAGLYFVTAILSGGYIWSDGTTDPKVIEWKILQAGNPMKLKTKTATVKKSKLKKKNLKLARSKVLTFTKSAKGKVTYTKLSGSGRLSISKTTGDLTVKKKTKKGTYQIKVKVRAAGNDNYKALSKNVTLKVKVK